MIYPAFTPPPPVVPHSSTPFWTAPTPLQANILGHRDTQIPPPPPITPASQGDLWSQGYTNSPPFPSAPNP